MEYDVPDDGDLPDNGDIPDGGDVPDDFCDNTELDGSEVTEASEELPGDIAIQ